jgi:hypothetical protein
MQSRVEKAAERQEQLLALKAQVATLEAEVARMAIG